MNKKNGGDGKVVRVSGLASGMDIDQIVSDLMKAERMPIDKNEKTKANVRVAAR